MEKYKWLYFHHFTYKYDIIYRLSCAHSRPGHGRRSQRPNPTPSPGFFTCSSTTSQKLGSIQILKWINKKSLTYRSIYNVRNILPPGIFYFLLYQRKILWKTKEFYRWVSELTKIIRSAIFYYILIVSRKQIFFAVLSIKWAQNFFNPMLGFFLKYVFFNFSFLFFVYRMHFPFFLSLFATGSCFSFAICTGKKCSREKT